MRRGSQRSARGARPAGATEGSLQQVEADLKHTLSLLAATLESTADGILVVNLEGEVVGRNRKFAEVWRIPEDLLQQKDDARLLEFVRSQLADPDAFLRKVAELYDRPEADSFDVLVFRDGRIFERYSKPQRIDGATVGRVWSFRDVTQHRRAEEALRESERKYRDLVETSTDLIWSLDAEGRLSFVNQAVRRIYGREPAEMIGRPLTDFTTPEQGEKDRRAFARLRDGEPLLAYETEHLRKDGGRIVLRGNAIALRDQQGRYLGITGTAADITEAKRAEQLQAATYRISEAAQTAPDLPALFRSLHEIISELMPARNFYIALHDPNTDTLSFPYYVDEKYPPSPSRKVGKGVTEYVLRTQKLLLVTPELRAELVRCGEVDPTRAPAVTWLGVPLRTPDRIIGVLAAQSYSEGVRYGEREKNILLFVSAQAAMAIERKRAAELLRESERKYRLLFEANPEAIWLYDEETRRFLAVNAAAVARYGYSREEFLGMTIRDLCPMPEQARLDEVLAQRAEAAVSLEGVQHCTKAGAQLEVDMSLQRVEVEGRAARLVLARDVTERKRLELQLRQAQKMEAVGRLAGGVAHDFNNIMSAILGYSDLVLDQLAPGDPLRRDMEEIRQAGRRAATLTRQLLAFGRKQMLQPEVVDVNDLLADLQRMLQRLIGENIELVTLPAAEPCRVKADSGQLEQVIVNLALNARDAMPRGGRLVIQTRAVQLGPTGSAPEPGQPVGPHVLISVSDTGGGIDEETKAHLFEPFFTTKERGGGTGLGLATVYGIVQQSGGQILVHSAPSRGATFEIYLARVDEPVRRPAPRHRAPSVKKGCETVLLVEDEDQLRSLVRKVLESQGYLVVEAANGAEAEGVAARCQGPIHLLLSDVIMPQMGGPELAERLGSARPQMKVLFMSGYTDDALKSHPGVDIGGAFLQKPFTPEQLARKIREILDSPRLASAL